MVPSAPGLRSSVAYAVAPLALEGRRYGVTLGSTFGVPSGALRLNTTARLPPIPLYQVEFVAGGSKFTFSNKEAYDGTAFAARERLVESFNKTMKFMK